MLHRFSHLITHKATERSITARSNPTRYEIDQEKVNFHSKLVLSRDMTLPGLVRFIRGESKQDSRPNKALIPSAYATLLHEYQFQSLMIKIAKHGIIPQWRQAEPSQQNPPRNLQSTNRHLRFLIRSLRERQDRGQ
jgi:hypothetical protein